MQTIAKKFIGTGVALVTPFKNDNSVDFDALGRLVEYLISNGVNYLVSLGTTGEPPTLSREEKVAVVKFVKHSINKRVPLVLGIGGNSTNEMISQFKETDFSDIDAILSVTPYYNKPNQRGLYAHYKALAQVSPLPIIMYNVPGRTGINLAAETVVTLAKEEAKLIAVKEASGNFEQIMQILKHKPEQFLVISGDDGITLPLISLGVSGVISVVANAFPKHFSTMVNLCLSGNFEEARKIHYQLIDITNSLFVEGSPAGVKAALSILGIVKNYLRLPLVPVTEQTFNKLSRQINELKM